MTSYLKPVTLLKKRLWHRCCPVNFQKFLKTPFSQNISGWVLLYSHHRNEVKRWCINIKFSCFLNTFWIQYSVVPWLIPAFFGGEGCSVHVLDDSKVITAFYLFRCWSWVLGTPGSLVVKSKLSPCSSSVVLRQLKLMDKRGHKFSIPQQFKIRCSYSPFWYTLIVTDLLD